LKRRAQDQAGWRSWTPGTWTSTPGTWTRDLDLPDGRALLSDCINYKILIITRKKTVEFICFLLSTRMKMMERMAVGRKGVTPPPGVEEYSCPVVVPIVDRTAGTQDHSAGAVDPRGRMEARVVMRTTTAR